MSSFVPTFTKQEECEPFVCPGTYAPGDLPSELLVQRLRDLEALVPEADKHALESRGFNRTKPVPPPPDWNYARVANAVEWMKLASEVEARRNVLLYRPWTSDVVCGECQGWIRPNSVKIGKRIVQKWPWFTGPHGRFSWLGVEAVESRLPGQEGAEIVTCGMLKDEGKIADSKDCEREKASAKAQYDDLVKGMVKHVQRMVKTRMVGVTILNAVYDIVYAVVVFYVPFAAAAAPLHTLIKKTQTKLALMDAEREAGVNLETDIHYDLNDIMSDFVTVTTGPLGEIGPVGEIVKAAVYATKATYDIAVAIQKMKEERKEQKAALREKKQRLIELNEELARMISDREEYDKLSSKLAELRQEQEAVKAMLDAEESSSFPVTGGGGNMGLLLLGLALVFARKRGR